MLRVLVVLSLLVSAPLAAQDHDRSHHRNGRHHGPRPVERLLEHRAELGLDSVQVRRLEQIRDELRERNRPLVDQLLKMRAELKEQRGKLPAELTSEQREQLRERARAARPLMRQIRESHRQAFEQIREVLTPAQRERIRERMERHRERHDRGAHGRDQEGKRQCDRS